MTTALAASPAVSSSYVGRASSAERMETLHRLNALAGYTAVKTILPEGTALWDIGQQALVRERVRLDKLPALRDFARVFLANEQARQITDKTGPLGRLRMDPRSGKIYRLDSAGKPGCGVGYTHTGLSQLVGMHADALGVPSNFVRALEFLSPGPRATAFNDLGIRAEAKGLSQEPRVMRLAKNVHGEQYLRAVTSTKHVGIAGGYAAVVSRMVQELGLDADKAKVRVAAEGDDRLDIEVIFPMLNREIVVGDVLWGSLALTLSETKDVSARISDSLMRVLCANLTRAPYGCEHEWTRKHVGTENFVADLMTRIQSGAARLAPFVRAFGDAYADELPGTRAEAFERLEKMVDLPKSLTAESVLAAWDADGAKSAGSTRGGLVNALTRASQDLSITDAEVVEAAAGGLVLTGWN